MNEPVTTIGTLHYYKFIETKTNIFSQMQQIIVNDLLKMLSVQQRY